MKEHKSTNGQSLVMQRLYFDKEKQIRRGSYLVAGIQKEFTSDIAKQETSIVTSYTTLDSPVRYYDSESEMLAALKTLISPEMFDKAEKKEITSGPYVQKTIQNSYAIAGRLSGNKTITFTACTKSVDYDGKEEKFFYGSEAISHHSENTLSMIFVRDGSYKYKEIMVLKSDRKTFDDNLQKTIDGLCAEKTLKIKTGKAAKKSEPVIASVQNPDVVKAFLDEKYSVVIAYGNVERGAKPAKGLKVLGRAIGGTPESILPEFYDFLECAEVKENWGDFESRLVFHHDEKQKLDFLMFTAQQAVLLDRQNAEGTKRQKIALLVTPQKEALKAEYEAACKKLDDDFNALPENADTIRVIAEKKALEKVLVNIQASEITVSEMVSEKEGTWSKANDALKNAFKALETANKALNKAVKPEIKAKKQEICDEKQAEVLKAKSAAKAASDELDLYTTAESQIFTEPVTEETAE